MLHLRRYLCLQWRALAAGAPSLPVQGSRWLSSDSETDADTAHASEEELQEFRETVRGFASDLVAPRAADIDRDNAFPKDINLWTTMGEMGLLGEQGSRPSNWERVAALTSRPPTAACQASRCPPATAAWGSATSTTASQWRSSPGRRARWG